MLDRCFSGQAVAAMSTPDSLVAGRLEVTGTFTLTSTTATAASYAPPGDTYTTFTEALLGALRAPGQREALVLSITSARPGRPAQCVGFFRRQQPRADERGSGRLLSGDLVAVLGGVHRVVGAVREQHGGRHPT